MTDTHDELSAIGRRVAVLDGVRGIAILWVVIHNCMFFSVPPTSGPFHMLAMISNAGWIGVQLFFVLSGFLITGNLLDAQHADNYFSSFYMRRILRIFPLYYSVLFLGLTLWPLVFDVPQALAPALHHQGWLWFHLTNWTHEDLGGFSHFWSLAVEEQFYLLWPLLVYRLSPRRLLLVCIVIAVGSLAVRSTMVFAGVPAKEIYIATVCRMDALALGAAAAAAIRIAQLREWLSAKLTSMAWVGAVLFALGIPLTRGYSTESIGCETFGYTGIALAAAVMVLAVTLSPKDSRSWIPMLLRSAPLRSLGKYSYAIYVFHVPLHRIVGIPLLHSIFGAAVPAAAGAVYALIVLVVSYALAFCSYHGLEKHFLRLKHRFPPRASTVHPDAV